MGHRRPLLLLLLAVATLVNVAAGKFCPKEKNRDKCKATDGQYKCGVFYKNLVRRRPLTYIGALPDDLTADNEPQWEKILGPSATPESFNQFDCDEQADKRANSRCYTIMNRLATGELDKCDDTLLNHKGRGGKTLGDSLCDQLHRFLSKTRKKQKVFENGIQNQTVTFAYSQCGGDWTAVNNGGVPLTPTHNICCHSAIHVTSPKKYYRCDNPEATRQCDCNNPVGECIAD